MAYTLPDLPYDYSALEPHISAEIMQLHHDKHHALYVKTANETLEKLQAAREKGDFGAIVGLEKTLAFNLGGHVNHSIFWENMTPNGADRPDGELAAAIDEFFGSFDAFKDQFTNCANTVQGSGWAMLCYDPLGKRLNTYQLYDQHANAPMTQIPLVVLDMWEHSFYLQYKNVKADYVKAWWNVVNWADAAKRFSNAQGAQGLIQL